MGVVSGSEDRTVQNESGLTDGDSELDYSLFNAVIDAVVFAFVMVGFLGSLVVFCGAING